MKPEYKNPQAAFNAAIATGRLSATPGAHNYAGNYMYMGTYSGAAQFKNINTRAYLPNPAQEALERLATGTPAILANTNMKPGPYWPRLTGIEDTPENDHSEEAEEAMLDALYSRHEQNFPAW